MTYISSFFVSSLYKLLSLILIHNEKNHVNSDFERLFFFLRRSKNHYYLLIMNANQSINVFIDISPGTKTVYSNFNYPLYCNFERRMYDSVSRNYVIVDDRKVIVQEGSLPAGINIHLTEKSVNSHGYRLKITIEDGQGFHLESEQWMQLRRTGMIDRDTPQTLNTFYVKLHAQNMKCKKYQRHFIQTKSLSFFYYDKNHNDSILMNIQILLFRLYIHITPAGFLRKCSR